MSQKILAHRTGWLVDFVFTGLAKSLTQSNLLSITAIYKQHYIKKPRNSPPHFHHFQRVEFLVLRQQEQEAKSLPTHSTQTTEDKSSLTQRMYAFPKFFSYAHTHRKITNLQGFLTSFSHLVLLEVVYILETMKSLCKNIKNHLDQTSHWSFGIFLQKINQL